VLIPDLDRAPSAAFDLRRSSAHVFNTALGAQLQSQNYRENADPHEF
jgi:hypothetical protein